MCVCVCGGGGGLGAFSEKVLDPVADGLGKSYVHGFCDQSAWDDCVTGRADVYEEHPHTAPLVFEMGQCYVKSCGDGILSRPNHSSGKVVRVEGG